MNEIDVRNHIKKNYSRFSAIVSRIADTRDETRQILLCSQAALFAVHHPCGVFSSPEIEKCLLKISGNYSVPLTETFTPDSVLHVVTRAFPTGGHTRVCERWIESSMKDQMHSVMLINQGHTPIPDFLAKSVSESGGEILTLKADTPVNAALQLRQIASKYQFVVLHIHMHDVIPMLAFGNRDFKRPVMLFNHADHLFWLGGSVIDCLINFRTMSVHENPDWRGVDRNALLPLPSGELVSKSRNLEMVAEKRKELALSPDHKIIITIGSSYKFEPFAGLDFMTTMETILMRNKNAVFVVIGPSPEERRWSKIIQKFPDRVKVLGIIPYSQIDSYLQIADVALEPFPLGSPTALIDAVQYGISCLSLATPVSNYDAFVESGILCATPEEVIERVLDHLDNPTNDHKLIDILQRESTPQAIRETIRRIISGLNSQHGVYDLKIRQNYELSAFELFVAHQSFKNMSRISNRIKTFVRQLIYWGGCYLPVKFLMRAYPVCYKYFLM